MRKYNSFYQSDYLDSGLKGRKGESHFRNWLSLWLPKKVEIKEGVVIDKDSKPTTQRDVIIFDSYNCPIFKDSTEEGEINILPIEGVVATIEINASRVKKDKIIKDIDKVAGVKKLKPLFEPAKVLALETELAPGYELKKCLSTRMSRLGYIFAKDCDVSLEVLATAVEERNTELGVDASVDGIFILEKGCILHGNEEGWTTSRIPGTDLFTVSLEPWSVLLTLVSMINQHLALGARGNTPSLEEYFRASDDQRENILANRKRVNVADIYAQQPSSASAKLG